MWGSTSLIRNRRDAHGSCMSITKRAFVTVGSTKFDDLIASILQEDILNALRDSNFTHLVVQCGESALPDPWTSTAESLDKDRGIQVEIWKYKPSIEEDIAIADLVISHAGQLSFQWTSSC